MVVGVSAFGSPHALTKTLARWRFGIVASVVLLALVLAPGFGSSSGGASRWLGVGLLRIQPSEFAKLALCLYAAHVIADEGADRARVGEGAPPPRDRDARRLVARAAQPDMGTAVVLIAIALACDGGGGPRARPRLHDRTARALRAVAAVALPYRRERLLSFLHPQADPSGAGYQLLESKIGLGSGHLFGVGLGNSSLPWGFLPNPHTDFIFSIVGNDFGLVGALGVLALLIALVLLGLRVASQATDRFSQLTAVGIATGWPSRRS